MRSAVIIMLMLMLAGCAASPGPARSTEAFLDSPPAPAWVPPDWKIEIVRISSTPADRVGAMPARFR